MYKSFGEKVDRWVLAKVPYDGLFHTRSAAGFVTRSYRFNPEHPTIIQVAERWQGDDDGVKKGLYR